MWRVCFQIGEREGPVRHQRKLARAQWRSCTKGTRAIPHLPSEDQVDASEIETPRREVVEVWAVVRMFTTSAAKCTSQGWRRVVWAEVRRSSMARANCSRGGSPTGVCRGTNPAGP